MTVTTTWLLDETHYPILHLLLPYLLSWYYADNLWIVITLVYVWESMEVFLFWMFGSYEIFLSEMEKESVEDSLLLDPLQAGLGILLHHIMKLYSDRWYANRPSRLSFWTLFLLTMGLSTILLEYEIAGAPHGGYTLFVLLVFFFSVSLFYQPHTDSWQVIVTILLLLFIPILPTFDAYVFRTWLAWLSCLLFKILHVLYTESV